MPKLPLNCLGPCRSSAGSFYPNSPALRPAALCAGGITRAEITRLDRDRVYRRVQDGGCATTGGAVYRRESGPPENGQRRDRAFNSAPCCLLHRRRRYVLRNDSPTKSARRINPPAPANLHNPFSSAAPYARGSFVSAGRASVIRHGASLVSAEICLDNARGIVR